MENNDNVVRLGAKVKPDSPVAAALEEKNEQEFYAQQKQVVISFLEHHLEYIKTSEIFEAHGCFLVVWNKDQSYLVNDAGAFPMATMCGLLDMAKQDFIMRHIMGQTVRPSDPEAK